MNSYDLIIIGAGAAGMFCASVAGQRGARVALFDHNERLAEKIRISGGGRCNFTNIDAGRPERYVGQQAGFAASALRTYPPRRFIDLLATHRIPFHEKHRGQLFCDESSERIIRMLVHECAQGQVHWHRPVSVESVRHEAGAFVLEAGGASHRASSLVIATGGLSIPKIGASDFAYRISRQFGVRVVEPRPGLVPLTFEPSSWSPMSALSGLSLGVGLRIAERPQAISFDEDLLFTHKGLSGPAILQMSNYWRPGESLMIDLAPGLDLQTALRAVRDTSRQSLTATVSQLLAERVPKRLLSAWIGQSAFAADGARRIAELSNRTLAALAQALHEWPVRPDGTEGYRKAEVTLGGIDTHELNAETMQVQRMPGLYFIGEAVDVTGWLGGYNFQWAWASGYSAAVAASRAPMATIGI